MRTLPLTLIAALLVGIYGCNEDPNQKVGRLPNPPAEAPPAPAKVNVPLDANLRSAAHRELSLELHSSDAMLRVHALEGVREANATSHVPEILAALRDADPRVRFAAALASGEMHIDAALPRLQAIADDPSENVRVAVRFALHKLGDKRRSHELERMAADASPLVRGNTAMVLGMLGEPSAVPILNAMRQDPSDPVRQQASEAMWKLGDEDGLKDLLGLSLSRYIDDRMIAYIGLAGPRDIRVRQNIRAGLVGDTDGAGASAPLAAARAMGMLGSDEGYVIAQHGAASSDPNQRVLAALAFGAIGRSDTQDILRKLLADPDPNVRIAAASAILQLK